jgi:hypothetical protein
MPRFYCDVSGSTFAMHDDEGQEFADREAARRDALLMLSEMARGLPRAGDDRYEIVASVRDAAGKLIFTASLSLVARWID